MNRRRNILFITAESAAALNSYGINFFNNPATALRSFDNIVPIRR
jgi:hypothetical protein